MSFRPGFVHYATFPEARSGPALRESVAAVLDAGFRVVEVSSTIDRGALAEAARAIQARGGTVFLSAGPEFVRTPRSLCTLNVEERLATVGRVRELVELARDIGAANLMLVSGADPGPATRETARAAFVDSARRVAGFASAGSRITFETFARERAPAQLLGPSADALAALDDAGGDLGVTIDLCHLRQLGEDLRTSARALARRSTHIHLSTCVIQAGHPLDGDQHPSFSEPGIALSLEDARSAVAAAGISGSVLSVEIRRHHGEEPSAFLRECVRWWETAAGAAIGKGMSQ